MNCIFNSTNKHMENSLRLSSYPPFYRSSQSVDRGRYTLKKSSCLDSDLDLDLDSGSIPKIDFEQMSPKNIGEACREWGIFRLINHGIPMDLLDRLHGCANQLFSLSFESKLALPTSPMIYFWGTPALYMSGNANNNPCSKNFKGLEGFDASWSNITQFKTEEPLLETFRSLVEEYGRHQMRVAKAVFGTMAEDINISPIKSNSYLCPSTARLRIYRYLPQLWEEQRLGMTAHTDSSVVTILHQDQVGGLQARKNGKWLNVKPIHDSLIVNIGDMMKVLSNDEYTSVEHRVKLHGDKERISFGYFIFPADDAIIESSKYRPFTYADFKAENESSLKTVGLKSGLQGFRVK